MTSNLQLVRHSHTIAGYDCLYAPCQHKVRGEHGICGERVQHAITSELPDGRRLALEVMISTDVMPDTVPIHVERQPPRMRGVVLHVQSTRGARFDAGVTQCSWFGPGVACEVVYDSALRADVLEPFLGGSNTLAKQPPEEFWSRLAGLLHELLGDPELFAQGDETATMADIRARHAQAQESMLAAQARFRDADAELRHAIGRYTAADPGYRRR